MEQSVKLASSLGTPFIIQLYSEQVPHRVRPHHLRQLYSHRQGRRTYGQPWTLGYCRAGRVQSPQTFSLSQLRCLPYCLLHRRSLFMDKCSQKGNYFVTQWYPELKTAVGPEVPKIFVGNKLDQRAEYELINKDAKTAPVKTATARKFVEENFPDSKYMECSALTQEGLKAVFD